MSEDSSRWYRGRLVVGPFRPFDVSEFDALEREIGLALPTSYRSFLEVAGGERLEYSTHLPSCEPEPLQSFDSLYQLGRDGGGEYGYGTLLGEFRHASEGWLADEVSLVGLLPIARNGGSDTLFLDLNPATHGRVHAFVHGISWPGYLQRGIFTQVAEDFDSYLASLVIDPEMAQVAWADVAATDPTDPWRRTVEEWLDHELAGWRAEPWAAP
ncbi:SMI1/KNR4 family protein [Streptomyces sp. NPDC058471]|uniref:SMI1/KNR4 family protein n=1 Tax=Streptomyces sp. NPDC058471 TaxID=3346516 RepID=UPI0036618711